MIKDSKGGPFYSHALPIMKRVSRQNWGNEFDRFWSIPQTSYSSNAGSYFQWIILKKKVVSLNFDFIVLPNFAFEL